MTSNGNGYQPKDNGSGKIPPQVKPEDVAKPSKMSFEFVKNVQKQAIPDIIPDIHPGETALEAIKRMEAERMKSLLDRQTPPPPPPPSAPPVQEVVFYEGYKLPRDFFTALALCIIKLKEKDSEVKKILDAFGFELKDLNGKLVTLKKRKK